MKFNWYIFLFFLTSNTSYAGPSQILKWPRMGLKKFGCLLEQKFGHRDKKFNCGLKNYRNLGDPCTNTNTYYEGVSFPQKLVSKIDSSIRALDLSWERGEIQSLSVSFKKKMDPGLIRKKFSLPSKGNVIKSHSNIASFNIQNCHKDYNCLMLEGFDHMGAGELDCPDQ